MGYRTNEVCKTLKLKQLVKLVKHSRALSISYFVKFKWVAKLVKPVKSEQTARFEKKPN